MPNLKTCGIILLILLPCPNLLASKNGFDWSTYADSLKRFTHTGDKKGINARLVDYDNICRNQAFMAISKSLETFTPSQLAPKAQLAFYINAYNYLAIRLICREQPKKSIKDIGNFLFPVWKKDAGIIGGETVSLDQIEHGIIRPMGEALSHFAVNCASLSCPNLRDEPYTEEKLDQQLVEQAKEFINDKSKGVAIENGIVKVSKIFAWYEEDFGGSEGVRTLISQHHPTVKSFDDYSDMSYDWRLNSSK